MAGQRGFWVLHEGRRVSRGYGVIGQRGEIVVEHVICNADEEEGMTQVEQRQPPQIGGGIWKAQWQAMSASAPSLDAWASQNIHHTAMVAGS